MNSCTDTTLDLSRIAHFVSGAAQSDEIAVIGLGSGGFPVMQQLAMSGWHRFTLIDPDILTAVNLAKHPARRIDIGRRKVDIAEEWLVDRNPRCVVKNHQLDVFSIPTEQLEAIISRCSITIVATDENSSRHYLNDLCVKLHQKMALGLVHRGGSGGTIFVYRPDDVDAGCYSCMEKVAEDLEGLPSVPNPQLTEAEQEMIYGRDDPTYGLAGLSSDIGIVASLHASAAIGELLSSDATGNSPLGISPANWLALGLRVRETGMVIKSLAVPKIDGCNTCGTI